MSVSSVWEGLSFLWCEGSPYRDCHRAERLDYVGDSGVYRGTFKRMGKGGYRMTKVKPMFKKIKLNIKKVNLNINLMKERR